MAKKASNAAELKKQGNKGNKDWPATPVPQVGAPAGFKVARQVTLPSLAIKEDNQQCILRFDSDMRESKVITKDAKGNAQKPACIANVTDVQSGEQFIFLVGAVVEQNLRQNYDAATDTAPPGFVGKIFQITCRGKRTPNQKYKDFSILELTQD